MKIIMYTGPQCSLCDEASLLLDHIKPRQFEVEKINIRTSNDLYHLYGARIPVLKRVEPGHAKDSHELSWPFDVKSLQDFVQ